jgi:hypothetical protein
VRGRRDGANACSPCRSGRHRVARPNGCERVDCGSVALAAHVADERSLARVDAHVLGEVALLIGRVHAVRLRALELARTACANYYRSLGTKLILGRNKQIQLTILSKAARPATLGDWLHVVHGCKHGLESEK